MTVGLMFFFFFSSIRRHTRLTCDWSSDVCSSDLGPYTAIYYASKAYVLHFSEALAEELSGDGVLVSCLSPGPVETGFQKRAHSGGSSRANAPLYLDVKDVARAGYDGMNQGKRIVIPGWKNRALTELLRLFPRNTVTKAVGRMYKSKKG